MPNIYLLRHSAVDGPAALYGHTDVSAKRLQDNSVLNNLMASSPLFDGIISSPLRRCRSIAESFAQEGKLPLRIIDDLSEISFGDYDGLPFDDICPNKQASQWQQLERFWQAPTSETLPNGEPLRHFHQRVLAAWQNIMTNYAGDNLLIVCHGGVIRMILAHILQLNWQLPTLYSQLKINNASITHINHHKDANISQVCSVSMPISALKSLNTGGSE